MKVLAAVLMLLAAPGRAIGNAPVPVLPPAMAGAECGPVDVVLGVLRARFGERLLWWGGSAGGVTMMLTERPDTKTWTLLAVHAGTACMVGSGGSVGAYGA